MKKLLAAALLFTTYLCGQVQAQTEAEARDLFRTRVENQKQGQPGARVTLELLRHGKRQFVPPGTAFYAGDKVKLHFELNFPAYVEVANRGSSGKFSKLFPYPGAHPQMRPGVIHIVPERGDEWFEFDQTPGAEELVFAFSTTPIVQATVQAHPKPKPRTRPKAKPPTNASAGATVSGQADALATLNARSLGDEDEPASRDLKRVRVNTEQYFFCQVERVTITQTFSIVLEHQ